MLSHKERMAIDRVHGTNYIGEIVDDNKLEVYTCTRDSCIMEVANFDVLVRELEDYGADVHHFGSWLCGWFDVIYVPQFCVFGVQTLAYYKAKNFLHALDTISILDEDLVSEREYEYANECWESWGRVETQEKLADDIGLDKDFADRLKIDEWAYEIVDSSDSVTFSYDEWDIDLQDLISLLNGLSLRGAIDQFGPEMSLVWDIESVTTEDIVSTLNKFGGLL